MGRQMSGVIVTELTFLSLKPWIWYNSQTRQVRLYAWHTFSYYCSCTASNLNLRKLSHFQSLKHFFSHLTQFFSNQQFGIFVARQILISFKRINVLFQLFMSLQIDCSTCSIRIQLFSFKSSRETALKTIRNINKFLLIGSFSLCWKKRRNKKNFQ